MIALPSIAFGGFSGSAKDVTARQVGGRSILTVRAWPTGPTTNAQVVRRASLTKISKSWQRLSSDQRRDWDRLAETNSGQSVLGQKAEISGLNLYVRLNANRVMAGEALLSDAPLSNVAVPNVFYSQVVMTPELIVFNGIRHESAPLKLVVKMSGSQSAGISNGWSKTVIISSEVEDDWGEADMTKLYLKTIGVEPTPGQKVFIEAYWLDTSTGFTGQVYKDSVLCTGESSYVPRMKVTMDNVVPEESHVSSFDVDYSTNAPVLYFDAICLGHSNVASSEVVLDKALPAAQIGSSLVLGRGMGDTGKIKPQSYLVYMNNVSGGTKMTFAQRGGEYTKPTEVFGPGVLYTN
jgi:hypothetical protein